MIVRHFSFGQELVFAGHVFVEEFAQFTLWHGAHEAVDRLAVHRGDDVLREQAGVQATAQIEAIKTELGAAFNERVASASAAAKHFGLTDALNEAGLGTHPGVIKALAALGATLKEGEGGAPRGGQGGSKLTPVEARAKANSLMQRSQELRGKGNAAEADRLHKEAGDYFRMAHGA